MKTSLGIWAFGPMSTRFVPGGYQPQWTSESMDDKVRRAVDGLGDLIDDYEFHYPDELNPDNLDDVRGALDGHDIYCVASGMHLDPLFGKGGLSSPDDQVRAEAMQAHARRGRLRRPSSARTSSSGRGSRATTTRSRRRTARAGRDSSTGSARPRSARKDHGVMLFLEHKNSEPAMKIFMRNIGMTLHVIHTLRARASTTSRSTWTGST